MTWVPKNRATDGEDDESNGLGEENEKGKNCALFCENNYQPQISQNFYKTPLIWFSRLFFPKGGWDARRSYREAGRQAGGYGGAAPAQLRFARDALAEPLISAKLGGNFDP